MIYSHTQPHVINILGLFIIYKPPEGIIHRVVASFRNSDILKENITLVVHCGLSIKETIKLTNKSMKEFLEKISKLLDAIESLSKIEISNEQLMLYFLRIYQNTIGKNHFVQIGSFPKSTGAIAPIVPSFQTKPLIQIL